MKTQNPTIFESLLNQDSASLQIYDRWVLGYSFKRPSNAYFRHIYFDHKILGDHNLIVLKGFNKVTKPSLNNIAAKKASNLKINETENHLSLVELFEIQSYLTESLEGNLAKTNLKDLVPVSFYMRRTETRFNTVGIDYPTLEHANPKNTCFRTNEDKSSETNQNPWKYFELLSNEISPVVKSRLGARTKGGFKGYYIGNETFIPGSEFLLKSQKPDINVKQRKLLDRLGILNLSQHVLEQLEVSTKTLRFNPRSRNLVLSISEVKEIKKDSTLISKCYEHKCSYIHKVNDQVSLLNAKFDKYVLKNQIELDPKKSRYIRTRFLFNSLQRLNKPFMKTLEKQGLSKMLQLEILLLAIKSRGSDKLKVFNDNF